MSEISKGALTSENNSSFPNNNTGYITPTILRTFNQNMIDSLVDEISYTADSASVNTKITQLQQFSSSLDATFATDAQLTALSTSIAVTDLTQSTNIAALQSWSSSLDNDYVSETQFNAYTSSQTAESASFNTRINALDPSGSAAAILSLNAATASLYAYTASNDSKWNTLGGQTGSYVTEAESGSFVTSVLAGGTPNVISVTKGNGTINTITVNNVTSASFAFTASEARNIVLIARNGNASSLPAGTVVHITGASGDNPIFNTASFDSELLSANTLGILRTTAVSGADVEVLVNGIVTGVNTDPANGYVAGDIIYLSSSGQFTRVQPQAPNQIVTLGQVLRAQQNNGSIYVNITNGWELNELHNVAINSVADGDVLVYRSGSGLWTNSSSIELGNATTGSNTFNGNQSITGSVSLTGDITARSASFQYVQTIFETASIIYSSGSNQLGDELSDTQTLSGSVKVQGLFTVNGVSPVYENQTGSMTVLSASFAQTAQTAVTATTSSYVQSASFAENAGLLDGKDSSEFATTGSNTFLGNQTISASLYVRGGDINHISNNTTLNPDLYLTESLAGQVNIIKGWGENPSVGGAGTLQANYTGSIRITGSNNTVAMPQIRPTSIGGGVDQTGYISGSDNVIASNNAGIFLNTGSQLFPKTQNNQIGVNAAILMNFTTSSLSGGHPTLSSNTLAASILTINHNSGSITSLSNNWVNAGALTTTQNFVTNTRPTISNNIIVGNATTINHISSSVTYTANIANSPVTVNNHLSSSGISNNNLSITDNIFLGGTSATGHTIYVSGSQSSNASRQIADNLIGGRGISISSSFASSSNSNLLSSLVYGQALIVSGNHGTFGGTTFVGRYNESGSLANAQDIVFAVGTGTSISARRTGLWIDSGSNTNISGTLEVIGNSAFTGSVDVSGSTLTLNRDGGIALKVLSGSVEVTSPQGTGYFYSNLPITSSNLRINGPGIIADLFVSGVFSGNSTLNVAGNSYFTGSVFTSASVNGVVTTVTTSSNTASLDFSKGNSFTVQLVSGSNTHIFPTNVQTGQTVNVKVNSVAGAGVTFQSTIKQVSGSGYVPTPATGVDILTMVTFNTTSDVYLANVKNLI